MENLKHAWPAHSITENSTRGCWHQCMQQTLKKAQSACMHLKIDERSFCEFSTDILSSNVAILHLRNHLFSLSPQPNELIWSCKPNWGLTRFLVVCCCRGAHDAVSVCSGDSGVCLGWIAHGLQIYVDADSACYLQHLSGKNMNMQIDIINKITLALFNPTIDLLVKHYPGTILSAEKKT